MCEVHNTVFAVIAIIAGGERSLVRGLLVKSCDGVRDILRQIYNNSISDRWYTPSNVVEYGHASAIAWHVRLPLLLLACLVVGFADLTHCVKLSDLLKEPLNVS